MLPLLTLLTYEVSYKNDDIAYPAIWKHMVKHSSGYNMTVSMGSISLNGRWLKHAYHYDAFVAVGGIFRHFTEQLDKEGHQLMQFYIDNFATAMHYRMHRFPGLSRTLMIAVVMSIEWSHPIARYLIRFAEEFENARNANRQVGLILQDERNMSTPYGESPHTYNSPPPGLVCGMMYGF